MIMTYHTVGNYHAFMPEEVKALGDALDGTIEALQFRKYDDWLARLLARQIIEFAKDGERDPERLCLATLASFGVTLGTHVRALRD
jgi:hypothetical protein